MTKEQRTIKDQAEQIADLKSRLEKLMNIEISIQVN